MEKRRILKVIYKDDLGIKRIKELLLLEKGKLWRFHNPKNNLDEWIPESSILRMQEIRGDKECED